MSFPLTEVALLSPENAAVVIQTRLYVHFCESEYRVCNRPCLSPNWSSQRQPLSGCFTIGLYPWEMRYVQKFIPLLHLFNEGFADWTDMVVSWFPLDTGQRVLSIAIGLPIHHRKSYTSSPVTLAFSCSCMYTFHSCRCARTTTKHFTPVSTLQTPCPYSRLVFLTAVLLLIVILTAAGVNWFSVLCE